MFNYLNTSNLILLPGKYQKWQFVKRRFRKIHAFNYMYRGNVVKRPRKYYFKIASWCGIKQKKSLLDSNWRFFYNYYFHTNTTKNYKLTQQTNWHTTYILYFQYFLQQLYAAPIKFKLINLINYTDKFWIRQILKRLQSHRWSRYNIIYFGIIAETVFLCFVFKDLHLIIRWITLQLQKTHFKTHRTLMSSIGLFLMSTFNLLKQKFSLCGFYFMFKGKLGMGGSVRKRKMQFKMGHTSLTAKQIKYQNQNFTVRTLSGTVGGCLTLFYN